LKNLSPEERKKTVILTRTNEIDPYLVFALKSSRIPFTFTSKAGSVYDGIVGKDILAYLNMTQGEIRKDDFLRVINRPNRYVPTSMIAKEELNFERLLFDYRDKQYLRDNLRIFKKNLDIMGRLDPYAAIIYLRKAVGYEEYLKRNVLRIQTGTGSAVEENTVMDDLTNITEMAKNFETISDFIRACTQLSDELAGEKTVSGSPGNDKFRKGSLKEETEKNPGVSVMTMHASKGLEFDTVILPDINEGRVPIRQAVTKEEIEEERRILYVAMTRAKERLFLCSVNERNPFLTDKGPVPFSGQRKVEQKTGQTVPSRFLDEILN
ncbi:MAG: ATP-dependent helicase, partial [Lachnospiraceae bacterium]|nr:ATP-dependent helicase [Lachnospiraceae bacterium]